MLMRPYRYAVAGGGFSNDYSMLFDGVDEYIDCGRVTATESAANMSVSFYIKLPDVTGAKYITGKYQNSSNGFWFSVSGNNIRFENENGGNRYCVFNGTTLSADTWYHITYTYDGGGATDADKVKVYLDGGNELLTFSGAPPSTLYSGTHNWYIGGISTGILGNLEVDEVAIYDYTLSSSNVTTIYNSGTVYDLDLLSTPPIHWWRNGDGSDTISTIYDVGTSASNDGTPTNMESGDITTDVP